MSGHDSRRLLTLVSVFVVFAPLLLAGWGQAPVQPSTAKGEWPSYGGDIANTRYSPLDQINAKNFSTLQLAWSFKTDHFGPRPEFKLLVRKLKGLGLTTSFPIGYEITELGLQYLDSLETASQEDLS